jgi:glyoxylase-like metal-dependent hydrolase (beta-lactamase superfamily II)
MSRRAVLVALVGAGSISIGAAAYQAQPKPTVREIQKVRDNLYFISGGDTNERPTWTGGNVAVFVTAQGVVMVDSMLPGNGSTLLERIKSVTDKPVIMLINTHTHFDHSGSNNELPASIEFVAHENTKANMMRETCAPVTNCAAFKDDHAKYLPKRTFKDTLSLFSGKDQINLYYFGRGHTSGDTWVVFPAVRALHTGDMFPRKHMPFIDVPDSGGSAVEFNATLKKAVGTIKNVDTVIGGHTPTVVTWNDFKEYTNFYDDFFNSVQAGLKAGKSAADLVSGYQVPEKFKDFPADPARVKANVEAIAAGK